MHFIEGDFFAGKSVCGVCVQVDGIGKVDVLNSHMYAPGGEGDNLEGAHRLAQAWELIKIVEEKIERGRHVILVRAHTPSSLLYLELNLLRRLVTSIHNRIRSL